MRKETIEAAGRRKTSSRSKMVNRSSRAKATASTRAKTAAGTKKTKRPSASAQKTAVRSSATVSARTTTDHAAIQKWAESRGGKPASVIGTERSSQHAGLLRIDFPGFSGAAKLAPISWKEWFQKFDQSKLAFLFQEKTKDGKQSRFFKLVKR